jgi:hypothetical protein
LIQFLSLVEDSIHSKGGSGKHSLPMVLLEYRRAIGKPFGLAAATREEQESYTV